MKKTIRSITLLMVFLLFAGCNNVPQSQPDLSSTGEQEDITIYYTNQLEIAEAVGNFRQLHPDVSVIMERFDSVAEMEERLIKELNTNTGPDVVLFDGGENRDDNHQIDLHKMAANGGFLALDRYLENDENFQIADYLQAAFEGCKMDGQQYFMPFTIKMLRGYFSASLFDQPVSQGETSLSDFMSPASDRAQTPLLAQDQVYLEMDRGFSNKSTPFTEMVFIASGFDFTLPDKTYFEQNKQEFKQVVDWIKLAYQSEQNKDKMAESASYQPTYFFSAFRLIQGSIWEAVPQLEEKGVENVQSFMLPVFSSSNKYCAKISHFGVLTKDCENPQLGYEFLKVYMDLAGDRNQMRHSSVKKENFYAVLEKMKVGLDSVDPRYYEETKTIYENIEQCQIGNVKLMNIIEEEFSNYFTGQADYESCYAKFINKISLYLDE